jgi:hypothetical protein
MMQSETDRRQRQHDIEGTAVRMAEQVSLAEQSVRQGRERWIKTCREVRSVLLVAVELSVDCLFDCPFC